MKNLPSIVNVGTYPIHDLDHPTAEQVIVQAKAQLASTGACHFPGFLSSEGLAAFLQKRSRLKAEHIRPITGIRLIMGSPIMPILPEPL